MSQPGAATALRLFVAVRPSAASATALARGAAIVRRAAEDAGVQARWSVPAGYHITVCFLGWSRPEVVPALNDAIERAIVGVGPFELAIAGLGCFPSADRARVVWAGVSAGERALGELAERVGRVSESLGFAREERPFRPHLTLARLSQPSDLRRLVATPPELLRSRSQVRAVTLFESSVTKEESPYAAIAEWALESSSSDKKRHTRPLERGDQTSDSDPDDGSSKGS